MKYSSNTLSYSAIAFIFLGFLISCNNSNSNGSNSTDTTMNNMKNAANTAGQEIKNAADTAIKDVDDVFESKNPDSVFLVKATTSNIKEIEMLKAGMDKGTNAMLKSDAKMMRTDHIKLGETVKKYAAKNNFILPSSDNGKADDALNSINSKTGNDWDKAWADDMVSDHKDAISTFEKYQDKVKDPELKAMIANTLPTLHAHLDMAQKLDDQLK